MGQGKRRGRERFRPPGGRRCVVYTLGAFWVSVDTRTGEAASANGHAVPVRHRDAITRLVLDALRKFGAEPEDPLAVRDLLFGD